MKFWESYLLKWILFYVVLFSISPNCNSTKDHQLPLEAQCTNLKRHEIEGHLSTKTPYRAVANLNSDPITYDGCRPTRLWSVIRHGSRNPSKKVIKAAHKHLHKLKNRLLHHSSALCMNELERLRMWNFNITAEEEKFLVAEGEDEMIELAERMHNRFPHLLPELYSPENFYFKYTAEQRTLKSAQNFATGLFGRHRISDINYPIPSKKDPILRYKMFEAPFMNATTVTATRSGSESSSSGVVGTSLNSIMNMSTYSNISSSTVEQAVAAGNIGSSRKTSTSEAHDVPFRLARLSKIEKVSDQQCPLCFQTKRHMETIEGLVYDRQSWRIRERMKTASVALVLCLNIGVDPPDVVKIQPCARLECWIDPSSVSAPKAMDLIGANLQMQYERWQPRARYKKCHDPTIEDVKKLCTSLRRNAKGERILFHYNGHGVPKPTSNGEIWVFNKTFTQYIPLSIFEVQSWMTAPSIYVYDCSNAGIIINSFQQFSEQHERDLEKALAAANQRAGGSGGGNGTGQSPFQMPQAVSYKNCIHLAACSADQILPMNAQLPADLFTSCLTTPINIALKWYTMQVKFDLVPQIQSDLIDKIPGKVNDRRTMMGELNWIFTAITDTIAWNTLPRKLFQRLFRQDLLVASLFRNFLLAERILRSNDCIPISHPALPQCFRHPMWSAWDLVVDLALQQLPDILERNAPYRQLTFFEEQLTAFQVWLDRESESRLPPEQLPIVLQVLLSQVHRLRALELLGRFLDLGPWAVNLALGVGIFPYVLKLLQSSAKELRPVLVFIWAKILAVDSTCQLDLVKEHKYFLSVLQDNTVLKKYRTLSAFVLSCIVNNFLLGQQGALQGSLVSICLEQLNDESWLLRQWLVICLGMLWQNFDKARWSGVRDLAHEKLYPLLKDDIPEVRAAAVFALGTFISSVTDRSEEHANNIDRIIAITLLETVSEDMSPLVRLELVAALQWMVLLFESQFVSVYMQENMGGTLITTSSERSASISQVLPSTPSSAMHHSTHSLERHATMRRGVSSSSISNMSTNAIPFQSIFLKLWQGISNLGEDPFPKIAEAAQKIISHVRDAALTLITAKEATSSEKCINLSVSLPPSPNTRVVYLSGESPPISGQAGQSNALTWASKLRNSAMIGGAAVINEPQALLQRKFRTSSMNDETDSSAPSVMTTNTTAPLLASISGGGGGGNSGSGGDGSASARSSTSETNYEPKSQNLKPIITTEFIPWAISYFSRAGKSQYDAAQCKEKLQVFVVDKNSGELRAREYRFQRNEAVRTRGSRQHASPQLIDTQAWVRKTQCTPSLVRLLPFGKQIAVGHREKVLVFDWGRNTMRTYLPLEKNNSSKCTPSSSPSVHTQQSKTARVSSIEFLNEHDLGLILAGHEDGTIRIWQPAVEEHQEPRLVISWDGLPSMHSSQTMAISGVGSGGSGSGTTSLKYRRDAISSGLVTAWQQCTQHLVVGGGNSRFLRVWDINRELKLSDIPLGSETSLTVMSPFQSNIPCDIIVAGCTDGSLRLFDKRCAPQDARIRAYRDHSNPIMAVSFKDKHFSLVAGCSQGRIAVFDLRARSPNGILHQWEAGNDVTSIAIHQLGDNVACGSANKITIYNQSGQLQNVLRNNEGFMGSKIGHPTCLSFHSYTASLAAGYINNTIAVYEPSQGPEMNTALDFLKRKTQINDITPEEMTLIYTICAFDTAWSRHKSPSIWCSLFNLSTIKILEYAEDLQYYWKDGYGYKLTSEIACPAFIDMIDHISPNSNSPNATFYFTHSGTILKFLTYLGLYKDDSPLTYKDFDKNRQWRTSNIDAFASNIAFILYECENKIPMVLTMHQERIVHLPNCPMDSDLCSLETLRNTYNSCLENNNFSEICHKG